MNVLVDELITDNRIYDLARYFGLKDKTDRLQNRDALMAILKWGEAKTKSLDVNVILSAVRQKERTTKADSSESPIASLRRAVYIEQYNPEGEVSHARGEKQVDKRKNPETSAGTKDSTKKVGEFKEEFRQGLEEANGTRRT